MSDSSALGAPLWHDLTVPNAEKVRDFYKAVIGWGSEGMPMEGGYEDYVMTAAEGGQPVGGVCHAQGPNASLPPVWLIYFTVADVDAAVKLCEANGGKTLHVSEPGSCGGYAVIQDPAGAICAITTPPPAEGDQASS